MPKKPPTTVAALKAAPWNPREIDEDSLKALGVSMGEFGDLSGLVFNVRSGHLVAGHQRRKHLPAKAPIKNYRAAKDEHGTVGYGEIVTTKGKWRVRFVDWPAGKEKVANVAANSQLLAGGFTPGLLPILEELKVELLDLSESLRFPSLADMVPTDGGSDVVEDDVPEPPKKAVTQKGDLWVLGDHRLFCGDATAAKDVEQLLSDNTPFIMVTDPPYGVQYDPNWRQEAAKAGHLAKARRAVGKVSHDDKMDWTAAWVLFAGAVVYVWHAGRYGMAAIESLEKADFEIRAQIIWRKPMFVISRGHYHWQHEPCWYAVRKGGKTDWVGGRSQSTVWDISNKQKEHTDHSAQKPVECMARPIQNHGKNGDVVYDPFLGSGTTLIAAEQLNRRCYGLEIEPRYCDVVVERWENLTDKKVKRTRP